MLIHIHSIILNLCIKVNFIKISYLSPDFTSIFHYSTHVNLYCVPWSLLPVWNSYLFILKYVFSSSLSLVIDRLIICVIYSFEFFIFHVFNFNGSKFKTCKRVHNEKPFFYLCPPATQFLFGGQQYYQFLYPSRNV